MNKWKKIYKRNKNYLVLDFLKVKYHKKINFFFLKKIKINHSIVHTLNTNYYLKYLQST